MRAAAHGGYSDVHALAETTVDVTAVVPPVVSVVSVQGYLVSEAVPALELSSRCLRWSTARVTGMALY